MEFGNYQDIIYVLVISFFLLLFFAYYLYWKRKIVSSLFSSHRQRIVVASSVRVLIREIIIVLAIVLFAFSLLRPQWGDKTREVRNEGTDLLIVLDVSPSMMAKDVSPDRLSRAKSAIKLISENLVGDRMGLILFSGDAFLQCPLTTDIGAFFMFLNSADPSSLELKGTNIGAAFSETLRIFKKASMKSKMMVLITDGEDHEGASKEYLDKFKQKGIAVYTVGIGGNSGEVIPAGENEGGDIYFRDQNEKLIMSKQNKKLLKMMANETGGKYVDISKNLSGISDIVDVVKKQKKQGFGSRIVKEKKEQYYVFVLLLIILLLVEMVIPERKKIKSKRV